MSEEKTMIPIHSNHEELKANLEVRENVLILGPTASGKTKGVQVVAEELGLPVSIKVVGGQSTEASIMGYMNATGNYVEGIAYKPFTEGGILLIDEIDNGNPNVNLTLNALADGKVAFPCGMKTRHKDFCLVATANTINGATIEYCGRNRQDAALVNRFIFMRWDYDTKLELLIAINEYKRVARLDVLTEEQLKIVNTVVKEIWKFRDAVKELKINHIISPRTTLQVVRKLATGRSKKEIMKSVILKFLDTDSAKKLWNKQEESTLIEQSLDDELAELKKRYPDRFEPKITAVEKESKDPNAMPFFEPGNMPKKDMKKANPFDRPNEASERKKAVEELEIE